jgi:hypothetical protein
MIIIYIYKIIYLKMHVSTQKRIGKYTIMRTLGSGGSCKVKLGLDTSTGKKVAVKIMNDDLDSKT